MDRTDERSQAKVAYVIFDVDGTLVDNLSLIVESFNLVIADFAGRELSNTEAYARFGPTLEQTIADFVPEQELAHAIDRYHAHNRTHFKESAQIYSGVRELIRSLRSAGVETSACTGSSRRMAEITLTESDLDGIFSVVTTADDVRRPKPDPAGIMLTMQRMRANPELTVSLGDSPRDIEASRRAGIRSAAAMWGFGDESQLRSLRPDFVFKNPFDAIRLLG